MTRIALLSSEPVRPRMAGIGIRYLELARRLPAYGIDVVLVSPAAPEGQPMSAPSSVAASPPSLPTATAPWPRGSSPTTCCWRCRRSPW